MCVCVCVERGGGDESGLGAKGALAKKVCFKHYPLDVDICVNVFHVSYGMIASSVICSVVLGSTTLNCKKL